MCVYIYIYIYLLTPFRTVWKWPPSCTPVSRGKNPHDEAPGLRNIGDLPLSGEIRHLKMRPCEHEAAAPSSQSKDLEIRSSTRALRRNRARDSGSSSSGGGSSGGSSSSITTTARARLAGGPYIVYIYIYMYIYIYI